MNRLFVLAIFLLTSLPIFAQTTYHVSATGSNANPGTFASPYATVQFAIDNNVLGPGDSIIVGAGTWTDEPITFTSADEGDGTAFVVLQGADSATTIFEHFLGVTNAVHLNDADYIMVRNIKFDDASDDVFQITGGDNNVVENCWILDGADQVSIEASGVNTADNNVVRNNLLESDAFTYVDINGNNSGGSNYCDGNEIYDNIMRLMSGGAAAPGIELNFANNTEIYRNRIIASGRGIEIENSGGGDNTSIYNNYLKADNDAFYNNGATGTSSNGVLQNNSFYCDATCAYFRDISGANVGGWDIRNNIFYTTATSTSEYCIRIDGSTLPDFCDFNQYFHPGSARCARLNGTSYDELTGTGGTDWDEIDHSDEAGMMGDESSQQGDPLYFAPGSTATTFLDLQVTSPSLGQGTTIHALDINQAIRPLAPAIGAYDIPSALPVSLLSFNGYSVNRKAMLFWQTATETDNMEFVVQRSDDLDTWQPIGRLEGAGNSTALTSYEFVDESPQKTIHYYRLKQTDYDGTSAYSEIRALEFEGTVGVGDVYPNPVAVGATSIYLPWNQEQNDYLQVAIYGVDGRLVKRLQLTNNTLEIAELGSGLYLLNIMDDGGNHLGTQRLIVE